MNDTAAYYLFSSLTQADAAIIGIGIVFVVYKLQSIENRVQLALQLLRTLNNFAIEPLLRQILENDDVQAKGNALKRYFNNTYYREMVILVAAPFRAAVIRKRAIGSLRFVALHMFISACCIFAVPFLSEPSSVGWLAALGTIIILELSFLRLLTL
jgi:hypothetical protein